MTLVDRVKYPITTRNLSEENQALIDAHNLDSLREGIAQGKTLNAKQKAILKELEEKERIRKNGK